MITCSLLRNVIKDGRLPPDTEFGARVNGND